MSTLKKWQMLLIVVLLVFVGQKVNAQDDLGLHLDTHNSDLFLYPIYGADKYPAINPWFDFKPYGNHEIEGNLGLGLHIQPKGNLSYSLEQSLGSRFSVFRGQDCMNSPLCGREMDGSSELYLHTLKGTIFYRF